MTNKKPVLFIGMVAAGFISVGNGHAQTPAKGQSTPTPTSTPAQSTPTATPTTAPSTQIAPTATQSAPSTQSAPAATQSAPSTKSAPAATQSASSKKLLLTTQKWEPYQIQNGKNLEGIAVKVVECVLKKMNRAYEIQVLPWKRAQADVEEGKAHGFFAASKDPKRDKYAVATDIIADQKWNWYFTKDSKFDPAAADFKAQANTAATLGSNMLNWLEENKYKVKAKPDNSEQMVKMLQLKRIDAFLANEFATEEAFKKLKLEKSEFKIVLNKDQPLSVYFGKKFVEEEPQFLKDFNARIAECRK